jgi:hypothetical protein
VTFGKYPRRRVAESDPDDDDGFDVADTAAADESDFELLPHAAATSASTTTGANRARRRPTGKCTFNLQFLDQID